MTPKILFSCCTHGDEHIGQAVFSKYPLGHNQNWSWKSILSNPAANSLNQRFVDQDLNRSFPGHKGGNYEQHRAYQISQLLPDFDFVLDIHQTTSKMDDVIFINQATPEILEFCSYFNVEHIICLNGKFGGDNKLLIDICPKGVAIEYARSGDFEQECERVLSDVSQVLSLTKSNLTQNLYRLLGKIPKSASADLNWQNFVQIDSQDLHKLAFKTDVDLFESAIYPIFMAEDAYPEDYCTLIVLESQPM